MTTLAGASERRSKLSIATGWPSTRSWKSLRSRFLANPAPARTMAGTSTKPTETWSWNAEAGASGAGVGVAAGGAA